MLDIVRSNESATETKTKSSDWKMQREGRIYFLTST